MITPRLFTALARLARPAALTGLACAALAAAAVATPAGAWWRGGFYVVPPVYFGPPVYPPPVYYPPPMYYAPPPVMYAPPAPPPPASGQSCNAGPYVCPMDRPVTSGSACFCLSNEHSKIWGRAS